MKMIKCTAGGCPKSKEICCYSCNDLEACNAQGINCTDDPGTCGYSEYDEETAVQVFQQTQVTVLKQITDIVTAKKKLEDTEKELKQKLQEAMEKYDIKKFESDILNITYVAATTATSIDSAKLKKKYPDIATECSKTSNKSAYVKVTIK